MRAFILFTALALGAVTALARPSSALNSRSTSDIGSIYAYGTNLSGLPVFYADAIAYIGYVTPPNSNIVTNVTFTLGDTELVASPNSTVDDWIYTNLAVDTASGAFSPVHFVKTENYIKFTDDNFLIFGSQLFWEDTDGILESGWFAKETDTDGLWQLKWDSDNTATGGVAVALKNLAPTKLTS